jgi:hypothetical protein
MAFNEAATFGFGAYTFLSGLFIEAEVFCA